MFFVVPKATNCDLWRRYLDAVFIPAMSVSLLVTGITSPGLILATKIML